MRMEEGGRGEDALERGRWVEGGGKRSRVGVGGEGDKEVGRRRRGEMGREEGVASSCSVPGTYRARTAVPPHVCMVVMLLLVRVSLHTCTCMYVC